MNRHTFKTLIGKDRSSLSAEIEDGNSDNEDAVAPMRGEVEVDGEKCEEDDGEERFNEIGEVMEPFNLRNERDGGHFDENMNYVFKREKGELDAWLANLDEASMEQCIGEAASAKKKLEEKKRQEEAESAKQVRKTPMELKMELLAMMERGETVSKAMRRMSNKVVQDKRKGMGSKPKGEQESSASENGKNSTKKSSLIDRMTEIANDLLSYGITGIYEMSYDAIEASTVQWEYRALDGTIQGPFTSKQIADWKAQGFFTGPSAVMMRRVGVAGVEWEGRDNIKEHGQDVTSQTKKRKVTDASTSSKRVKFDDEKQDKEESRDLGSNDTGKASHLELMDDFDNDDEFDGGGDKDNSGNEDKLKVGSVPQGVDTITSETRGPWMSSDDIDFGDYGIEGDADTEIDDGGGLGVSGEDDDGDD